MLGPVRKLLRPVKKAVKKAFAKPKPETLGREFIANSYLSGSGIEVGPLHNPLKVPATVSVKFVDRMSEEGLRQHYPELAKLPLVHVDIVDDGEKLETIASDSQNFVIANHFLEHSQDPIGTLKNMIRVLMPGGIIYLAVPDKRYCFDLERETTPIEHFLTDHANGPAGSKDQHFSEWVGQVIGATGEAFEREKKKLLQMDYSIHYHTWTLESFMTFLQTIQDEVVFEVELCMQNDQEILTVLRKRGEKKSQYRQKCGREGLNYLRGHR